MMALTSYYTVFNLKLVCCLDLITSKGIATAQYRAPDVAPTKALPRVLLEVFKDYPNSIQVKKAALPIPHLKHVAARPRDKLLKDVVKCWVLVWDWHFQSSRGAVRGARQKPVIIPDAPATHKLDSLELFKRSILFLIWFYTPKRIEHKIICEAKAGPTPANRPPLSYT